MSIAVLLGAVLLQFAYSFSWVLVFSETNALSQIMKLLLFELWDVRSVSGTIVSRKSRIKGRAVKEGAGPADLPAVHTAPR